jgi:hypothetical protein
MLVRRLYCPIPEEARSPHGCLGETLCGFGSRRSHQWNDGAICEAANSAAIDDLGPPNARFVRHNLVKVKDPPPPKAAASAITTSPTTHRLRATVKNKMRNAILKTYSISLMQTSKGFFSGISCRLR